MGSLRALWRTRTVLSLLIRRELKVRYASSKLGYVWTILDPLLTCLVFWLIFGVIFAGRDNPEITPYIVFLIAGYLPWMAISGSINEAAAALNRESKLVRSTNLPRELWILKVVGSKSMELVFSIPVLLAFMLIFQKGFGPGIVYLPLAVVLMIVPIVGIGFALAPLCVLYRDLTRVVRIVMRLLFYMTPVLYPSERVTEALAGNDSLAWVADVYFLNPFVTVLDLYRTAIYDSLFPGWTAVAIASGVSLFLLVTGVTIFRRLEGAVLKEI